MALKFDMPTAYDHIDGFSILINENPTDLFSPARGLQQEDSLSPYIFLSISHAISYLLAAAHDDGFIRGIKISQHTPSLMDELTTSETFLGLPILLSRYKQQALKALEDRMLAKTQSWKQKLLSPAGRATMIQSVLFAISTYSMSIFHTLNVSLPS
ncbi:uncharacterized protein LOC110606870 [Manihot esculenta]|uniref:uncharacterized protein LOC110606870 n=1 Tax=Manihot esculenta TaxID=3983 RepID=UPI001CC3AB88|nr:uncharacterized protein LOC110606870 [Manihot esculenta]